MTVFNIGDRVVINTDTPHHALGAINFLRGDEGVVSDGGDGRCFDTDGDIWVLFDNGRVAWVSPECLSKVGEPDAVNHPSHYTSFPGIEVIDLVQHLNFCKGNAVKYLARAGLKDPTKEIEDLRKALWYVEREIARVEALSA